MRLTERRRDKAAEAFVRLAMNSTNLTWWQEVLVATLILTLATSLFYDEVVFLGRTFLPAGAAGVLPPTQSTQSTDLVPRDDFRLDPGASVWQTAPWSTVVARDFAAGHVPLWDPYQGFGAPLLANGQSGGFDVLRLPVLIGHSALAWDLYYLLRTILGGVGAYLYARALGLVPPARFFLAIAYIFSGHFVLLGNNPWIEAYFLLPVVLLGTELILAGRRRVGLAVVAGSVCLSVFVGMPEVTLFVVIGGIGYGACRIIWCDRAIAARCSRLAVAATVGGAWLIGIALSAPLLIPLFEYATNATLRQNARQVYGISHANLADFYALVYLDEVQIYENRQAFPRAFVVGGVLAVPDVSSAIAAMSGKPVVQALASNSTRVITDADRVWEAEFAKAHGHPPSDQDWADRQWSLAFAAQTGHPPTDSDWATHAAAASRFDPGQPAVAGLVGFLLAIIRVPDQLSDVEGQPLPGRSPH